jgi:hypothetical protein
LTELGISESVAARLVQRYSRHRVLEKMAYLEFLRGIDPDKVQNPRGWLRRAIEENYGPPDGYLAPEEQERLDAAEKQKAREEAERARLAAEQTRGEQERIQSEQAVIARKLQDEYGTTVDDLAFWERAQWEIKYTASSDIADLMANARILKVKPDTIQIGVRYTDVWRRLQHPGTKKAITRVLMRVTDRPITLETILLS